jgi:hypothetical protein
MPYSTEMAKLGLATGELVAGIAVGVVIDVGVPQARIARARMIRDGNTRFIGHLLGH